MHAYTMNNDFTRESVENLTIDGIVGRTVHFFDVLDSTNTHATALAAAGAREGEVVIADCQTAGRGRLRGRVWHSPPGRNLYTSFILRPSIPPVTAPGLTLVTGVAVAELLGGYCPVSLKWPNDVLAEGKKICGILTEMRIRDRQVDFVVVGIGINVNMKPFDFQEELRPLSTSLREQTSQEISRLDLVAGLCRVLEKWYRIFIESGLSPVRERWLEYSGIVGKMVEVKNGDALQRGWCQGINDEGRLLLVDNNTNKTVPVLSGDVIVVSGR